MIFLTGMLFLWVFPIFGGEIDSSVKTTTPSMSIDPSAAGAGDTAMQYLKITKAHASRWATDARLINVVGQTTVTKPGGIECSKSKEDYSWTFIFHSPSKGLRCFAGCGGVVFKNCHDHHNAMSYAGPYLPLRGHFIDSSQAAIAANIVADKELSGLRCPIYLRLTFDKSRNCPVWNAEFVCESGDYIDFVIDASSGKVLYRSGFYNDKGEL